MVVIAICLAVTTMFPGCEPEENNPPAISVADNSSLTQEVFADNEQGKSGVRFTTTGAWTSSISTVTASSQSVQMRATSSSTQWISIDPDHGNKADTYTINITLDTNFTGLDRTAIITILCNGDEIKITVTQKGKTEEGDIPKYPESPYANLSQSEIVALLVESFEKSYYAPEVKSEGVEYNEDGSIFETYVREFNLNQKRFLHYGSRNGIINRFTYIENLTEYIMSDEGTNAKTHRTLPDTYWNNEEYKEELWTEEDLGQYTFIVSGRTFTGVVGNGTHTNVITLNENEQIISFKSSDGIEGDDENVVTFTYGNVNPEFPAGFNKSDFIDEDMEEPNVPVNRVTKINGKVVEYVDFEGVGLVVKIDTISYGSKPISPNEWSYVSPNSGAANWRWHCQFEYDNIGAVSQTTKTWDRYQVRAETYFHWSGNELSSARSMYQQGVVDRPEYLRTNFEYGDTEYTLGNIDINWLLGTSDYFTGLPASAIGVNTTKTNKLLVKKTRTDDYEGKYNGVFTYRYVFNDAGYITEIYETKVYHFENGSEESLIYEFEY
jgi:hypothetical protein